MIKTLWLIIIQESYLTKKLNIELDIYTVSHHNSICGKYNTAGVVLLDSLNIFTMASSGDLDPISDSREGRESECTGNFSSS
jgi:hypothetical protein